MRKKFVSAVTIAALFMCICCVTPVSAAPPLISVSFGYINGDLPEASMKITSYEEFEFFSNVYGDCISLDLERYDRSFFKYEGLVLVALTADDSSDSEFKMTGGNLLADPMKIEVTKTLHGKNNDDVTSILVIEGGRGFIETEKEISVIEDVSRCLENADYIQGCLGGNAEYNVPAAAKITSRSELLCTELYDKYNDDFFENNFLLSVNWIEPSSVRTHNITKLAYKNDFTDLIFSSELTQFFTYDSAFDILTPYCAVIPLPKKFSGGKFSSELNEIIQIYNSEQFIDFADSVNDGNTYDGKNIFLMNDIDLSSVCGENINGEAVSWEPINDFRGSFDGLGHTISGLYIYAETESRESYGLFGTVYGEYSAIKNLTVDGSIYVSRPDLNKPSHADCGHVAAIAGNLKGHIENCRSTARIETEGNALCAGGIVCYAHGNVSDCVFEGSVKSDGRFAGGICGYTLADTPVKNCINNGSVTGRECTGGIVGISSDIIINCSNAGDVTGEAYVGGIAGYGGGLTENCTNSGSIMGTRYIGGIIGEARNAGLKNCSNRGNVIGGSYLGGIIGNVDYAVTMEDCRNASSVSGAEAAGGIVGSTNTKTEIHRCCNTGAVTGTQFTGGIAGRGMIGLIADCYNMGDVSGVDYVGGISAAFYPFNLKNCYNVGLVSGSEHVGGIGHINGKDGGEIDNCYYIDSCCAEGTVFEENCGIQKTQEEFASGKVTYLLNGSTSDGDLNWYQSIGSDAFPLFDKTHSVVLYDGEEYYNKKSDQTHTHKIYSNTSEEITEAVKSAEFNDVPAGHWAKDAVNYVCTNGLFQGISANSFGPDVAMSRGMLVTVLWRLDGQTASGVAVFSDVDSDAYYFEAVAWANANGIVKGIDDTHFAPNSNITREQMAVILERYAELKGYKADSTAADISAFADREQVSAYALDGVAWANAAGLMNGRTETTLVPKGETTRAEVATIVQRFAQNVVKH